MARWLTLAVLALAVAAAPAAAAGLSGHYLEARTCDVYTGACFANADTGLAGKHAVLAWKIDKGSFDNVKLDGLGVVAVVAASDTLGLKQTGEAKAVLIVDAKANSAQRQALLRLARRQAGDLVKNVLAVEVAPVDLVICPCKEGGCARLSAGAAKVETRCIDKLHDRGCGGESTYYPPLTRGVAARPAVATEHSFGHQAFNESWKDADRRGAYLGSFEIR